MGVHSQRCDLNAISRYANRASPRKRSISEPRNHHRGPLHDDHNNTHSHCANSRQHVNADSESNTAADITTTNASRSTSSHYAPTNNAGNHNASPSDAAEHRATETSSQLAVQVLAAQSSQSSPPLPLSKSGTAFSRQSSESEPNTTNATAS
jgi:hypothetical protein